MTAEAKVPAHSTGQAGGIGRLQVLGRIARRPSFRKLVRR
jgi:hypothetical protein